MFEQCYGFSALNILLWSTSVPPVENRARFLTTHGTLLSLAKSPGLAFAPTASRGSSRNRDRPSPHQRGTASSVNPAKNFTTIIIIITTAVNVAAQKGLLLPMSLHLHAQNYPRRMFAVSHLQGIENSRHPLCTHGQSLKRHASFDSILLIYKEDSL